MENEPFHSGLVNSRDLSKFLFHICICHCEDLLKSYN